jgi:hypothetical protein
MEIVLIVNAESGQSAFPAESIEGILAPERRYNIINGKIVLSGFSDAILHHDADVLLSMSLFRMPTPAEQDAMFQEAQQASTAQEHNLDTFTTQVQRANGDGEAILTEQEQAPSDIGEQTSPDNVPPAQDNKKKASGGGD